MEEIKKMKRMIWNIFARMKRLLAALNPLVGDLIKYKFSRRLYEAFRAKEYGVARSEYS